MGLFVFCESTNQKSSFQRRFSRFVDEILALLVQLQIDVASIYGLYFIFIKPIIYSFLSFHPFSISHFVLTTDGKLPLLLPQTAPSGQVLREYPGGWEVARLSIISIYLFQFGSLQLEVNLMNSTQREEATSQSAVGNVPLLVAGPFPHLEYSFCLQPILASLMNRLYFLQNSLEIVTKELATIKQQRIGRQHQALPSPSADSQLHQRSKTGPICKEFSKHLSCPVESCRSRYSSKIALRAHIRRLHRTPSITD